MVARSASGFRFCTIETQRFQVQLFDENIHDADRFIFCDVVVQAFRKQNALGSVGTFDESLHEKLGPTTMSPLYLVVFTLRFHTASTMIGHGVLELFDRVEITARLAGSLDLIEPVVEEILRHDCPFLVLMRRAKCDIELDGFRILSGQRVVLMLGAANRDPLRFPDAEAFDPARPRHPHVAFGAGAHYCLGAFLARLEMGVAMAKLFEAFPGLHLANPPRRRLSSGMRYLQSFVVEP